MVHLLCYLTIIKFEGIYEWISSNIHGPITTDGKVLNWEWTDWSFIHPFVDLFIYLFIYSLMYLFSQSVNQSIKQLVRPSFIHSINQWTNGYSNIFHEVIKRDDKFVLLLFWRNWIFLMFKQWLAWLTRVVYLSTSKWFGSQLSIASRQ